MTLVYIGMGASGILAAMTVAEVVPTIKRWAKGDPYANRTGRRVKTIIVQKKGE